MFNDFSIDKIARQVRILKQVRYRESIAINPLISTDEPEGATYPCFITPDENSKEVHIGDFWSGRDKYMWIHCEQVIPSEWKDSIILGLFDLGKTGAGYNRGFESLLFINGEPYQGVDTNHMEVFIDNSLVGTKVNFDFRLWSGLEGGGTPTVQYHQINEASITTLDSSIDALYYLLTNLIETINQLSENDAMHYQLKSILIATYKIVNFNLHLDSAEFAMSAKEALTYCETELKKYEKHNGVTVNCVGHTHIDLAWLWRYKHTREKAQRSFMTVERLMERYPEYIFLQTQAQLYESVKEDHPNLYKNIRKRVKEGRWEASGGMWVEADCNIPSGESLTRQIVYGKRFFKNEFNVDNTFLWLPDVFGYSWALPQILKKAGIDTFITTKISWNEINRMPHDTFTWSGIDGTKILTHFITTPDEKGEARYYTYNGHIYPRTVEGIWETYQDKGLNQDLLLSYGYGDGGGGVTRDMLENIRAVDKIPALAKIQTSDVTSYVAHLHNTVEHLEDPTLLHEWSKELYLEFHRGTYTSQAQVKKMNRRLELLYRDAEIAETLFSIESSSWNKNSWSTLETGWKLILKNQFHDIIPGSSITEVYEDTAIEHDKAYSMGSQVYTNAMNQLVTSHADSFTIFNTTPWNRGAYVLLPGDENSTFVDAKGCEVPSQLLHNSPKGEHLVWISLIDAMGSYVVKRKEGKSSSASSVIEASSKRIETPYYTLVLNDKGQFISLFDKEENREVLNGIGNELQIFEDRPRNHDAWEVEVSIDHRKEIVDTLKSVSIEEVGSLCTKVTFTWSYMDSTISQTMVLYAHHKRIDFKTVVDWKERNKLLKVAFPVDIHATTARYDIQYGSLERATHNSTSWDQAQFEVVGHQWANFEEKNFGVALMNDSKYGYDIKGNTMRLSLLKGAERPDVTADLGVHEFTYSLYVHNTIWYESDLIPLAWDLNAPLTVVEGERRTSLPIVIENRSIALDAIKKSEDGDDIIIRFHEIHGGRTHVNIELNVPKASWCEVNLLEEPISEVHDDVKISRGVKPFEIVTIRVTLS